MEFSLIFSALSQLQKSLPTWVRGYFYMKNWQKKKLSSLTQNLVSDSSPPPSPSSRISTLLRIRPIQTNKQTNTLISIGCIITVALYSPLRPCETSKILKILKNLEYQGNN